MNLVWLVLSSFAWAGLLSVAGGLIQVRGGLSGGQRRTLWRCVALLAVAPWVATAVLVVSEALAPHWQRPQWAELAPEYSGAALVQEGVRRVQVAPTPSSPVISLELAVWLVLGAGWLYRAVANFRSARQLRRVLAATTPLRNDRASTSRDRWTRRLALPRKPGLLSTTAQVSPFTCNVVNPVICLPEGLADKLDEARLDLVLGHECVHIARRDAIWQPVERVIADVLWFNPFAWRIRSELDLARELSCDEAVLAATGARRAYASTLVDVARIATALPAGAPAASILSIRNGSSLRMRIENILSGSKKRSRLAPMGVVALLLVGAPLALAQVSGSSGPGAVADRIAPEAPIAPLPRIAPIEPIEPIDPIDHVAPPAPLPSAAPLPPAAPPAPPAPPSAHLGSQGPDIRATFPARVTFAGKASGEGLRVELEQTASMKDEKDCKARVSGLDTINVKKGDELATGDLIGVRKKGMDISVTCTSSEDIQIGFAPAPPAPPSPPSRVAPVAPPAPPAPPPPVRWSAPVIADPASITSPYGQRIDPFTAKAAFHSGVDIKARTLTPIHAPIAGTVTFAGQKDGYGLVVGLAAERGYVMRFGQLDSIDVAAGDRLAPGAVVGRMGSSGPSTGTHLHMEVYWNGQSHDPATLDGLVLIGG